jgi:hypothetical protein
MPQPFALVVVAWGEMYTRAFAEVCLPTLLAPGNLPDVRALGQSCLHLYTTPADEKWLASAPAYQAVGKLLPVHVHYTDSISGQSKYDRMNASHRDAMQSAQHHGQAAVVISPDCLYSANCLTRAEALLEAGAQAIALPGLIGQWETLAPSATAMVRDHVLNLPERKLMELALPRLHPFQQSFYVNAPAFSDWPVQYLWRIPGEGLLARYFHLHPLVVRPKPAAPPPEIAIDYDYLEHACELSRIHVVQDSDEMCLVSLCTAGDNRRRNTSRPLDIPAAAAVIANRVTPLHEHYCMLNLRLHETDCRSPRWAEAEAEAAQLIARVLAARRRYLDDPAWAQHQEAQNKRRRFLTKLRRLPARLFGGATD